MLKVEIFPVQGVNVDKITWDKTKNLSKYTTTSDKYHYYAYLYLYVLFLN